MKRTVAWCLLAGVVVAVLMWWAGGRSEVLAQTPPNWPPPPLPAGVEARADLWIDLPDDFDPENPVVIFRIVNRTPGHPIPLVIPTDGKKEMFTAYDLSVDGNIKAASALSVGQQISEFATTKRLENLPAGKTLTLVTPLKKMWKIPANWKTLEILPLRMIGVTTGFTARLKIVRDGQPPGAAPVNTRRPAPPPSP